MKDNTDHAWTSLCQFQLSSPAPLGMLSSATFVVSPCYESCQRKYPDFHDQGIFCDEGCPSSTSPVLVWAAITNWHRRGDLNNRHTLLTVLESGKSKMKMSTCLMSGEDPLSGLKMTVFLLYPYLVERVLWSLSRLITALIPWWGSTLVTSSKPNYPQRPQSHLRVRISTYKFGGGETNMQSITSPFQELRPSFGKSLFNHDLLMLSVMGVEGQIWSRMPFLAIPALCQQNHYFWRQFRQLCENRFWGTQCLSSIRTSLWEALLHVQTQLLLKRIFIHSVIFFSFLNSLINFYLADNCITMLCWFLPVYQHESATGIHVSSPSWTCLPPPTTHPTPQLWVVAEHQAELTELHSNFPLAIYFTCDSVYISMLLSQFIPRPPSPAVFTSLFSIIQQIFTEPLLCTRQALC